MLSPVGDHILQEFNTLYLTTFKTYKIARPPQTIIQEGRRPQTDKHLPQSPITCKFFYMTTFLIAFYQHNLPGGVGGGGGNKGITEETAYIYFLNGKSRVKGS